MGKQGSLQVADGHVADVATRVTAHASHSLGREVRDEGGEKGGDRRGGVAREGSGGSALPLTDNHPSFSEKEGWLSVGVVA